MRKFFAFLMAIILAFLAVTGVLLYRQGVSFSEVDLNTVKELWAELLPEPSETDEDVIDIIATDTSETFEENLSYDEHIEKGDYYFERGFLTFASNEYVKAANLEPNRIEPYQKLLKTNYELGDYTKATINAETILSMSPNDFNTKFTLALIYIKQSDFDSATTVLEELSASGVADAEVSYYRGLLKIVFDDHDGGKKFLKQAKSDSGDAELDKKINYFLDAYTEYEFAKAAEELYLSELLSRAYNKAGEYEMTIYKLKNVLKTRSDLRDAWILFGFAYLNLESYYFAQTAFERAYDLDSQWPTTQYFLGLTHAELGNDDEAIIYLNYALANGFEPEIVIHQRLADLYLEIEDYTNAVVSYEEVLDMNNEDINSFVRPIWIYLDYLDEPEKALELAELAVAAFPETAMSYNLLGWSQVGTDDQTEAEKNLKQAIELDPNLAASYYNLGKLYEVQNRDSLALEVYQKAYELDPSGSIGNLAAQRYNVLMTE
ncbi:tetratricopeptide repeat protein [Patescibacteria group bacterium]|nr:tetratricopeptide repeat protein [Patescibacteria group bacterium]MBU1683143.1 tetratricopeptide repeat protein [Patescibacteria group bacterium]MBU1935521.1 tetratricopeptide repeat protein [Patescibacteria group bacterium]